MKNEKGITLAALVVYVIVFSITITLLASLSNYIYSNLDNVSSEQLSSEEFNKFNVYFVSDVKESKKAEITTKDDETIIKLESGSVYTYNKSQKAIYKNKEKIARNIVSFTASYVTEKESNKNTIEVTIKTGKDENNPNFSKTIKYVLRYW